MVLYVDRVTQRPSGKNNNLKIFENYFSMTLYMI